jgi:hypothetical protein
MMLRRCAIAARSAAGLAGELVLAAGSRSGLAVTLIVGPTAGALGALFCSALVRGAGRPLELCLARF